MSKTITWFCLIVLPSFQAFQTKISFTHKESCSSKSQFVGLIIMSERMSASPPCKKKISDRLWHALICWLPAMLAWACDAPRHNPLDPKNPDYALAMLEGNVQTFSIPHLPLDQVNVFWPPENRLIQTDANGVFRLEGIARVDDWLVFSKSGFRPDSLFVAWGTRKAATVQLFLNAVPALDDLTVYSSTLNNHLSGQTVQRFQVVVSATVSDPDNDIDSVFTALPAKNFVDALEYDLTTRKHVNTFELVDFNAVDLEELVGHDFIIIVKDKFAHQYLLGGAGVRRVIKEEILFESPAGHQPVSATPTLQWKTFAPGFPFTFFIQIYTEEITPQIVYQKSDIPANAASHTVETPLTPGDYFWVIWCIDEFQNRSRSRPASFTVLP